MWLRIPQPDGAILMKPTKPVVDEDEVSTEMAGRMLGVSAQTVVRWCEEGAGGLEEGRDWRRNPSAHGRGRYRIKAGAVMRLKRGQGS